MSMVDVGEKLRQAREKKALTVEQIQKQTLIHAPILTALEEGRCDNMLTSTYVKSFLKKYAVFLGLDAKEMLAEYSMAHSDEPKAPVNAAPEKIVKPKNIEPAKPPRDYSAVLRRMMVALSALAIGAVVIFLLIAGFRTVFSMIKNFNDPKKIEARAKKNSLKTNKVSAKKAVEKEKSAKNTKPIVPKNVALNIVVKVKSPVWVEMKKDGEKFFQRVLPKGWAEPMTARDKVELFIANGEAVEIFLNGKSLGSPGKGLIKNLEITRSGMKAK